MAPWENRCGSGPIGLLILFLLIFWSPLSSRFLWILDPAGTPKWTQNRPVDPQSVQGSVLLAIFVACVVWLLFLLEFISARFLMKNRCFVHRFCSQLVSFFPTWRPLRKNIICNAHIFSLSHFKEIKLK